MKINDEIIGVWDSFSGTFDTMMSCTIVFSKDGTGEWCSRSVLSGKETMPLWWRRKGDNEISIIVQYPDEENVDLNDSESWFQFKYTFSLVKTDTSSRKCLVEVTGNRILDEVSLFGFPIIKRES